jgi:hypothetical protein
MKASSHPNGEDRDIAFTRCLLLDNRLEGTRVSLGTSLGPGGMLTVWEEWYEFFTKKRAAFKSGGEFEEAIFKEVTSEKAYTHGLANTYHE